MPVLHNRLDTPAQDFTNRLESFLVALSPSLSHFASKLIGAGIRDADTLHSFVVLGDEAVCLITERMDIPAFPRQLLRAGLRRLRESGWAIE